MVPTYILWLLAAATHILYTEARHFPLHYRQQAASEEDSVVSVSSSLPSGFVPNFSRTTSILSIDDDPATLSSFPTSAPTLEPSSVFFPPTTADHAVNGSTVISQSDPSLPGTSTSDGHPTITGVNIIGNSPGSSFFESSSIDTTSLLPGSDLSSTDTISAIILDTGSLVDNSGLTSISAIRDGIALDESTSSNFLDEQASTGAPTSGSTASSADLGTSTLFPRRAGFPDQEKGEVS